MFSLSQEVVVRWQELLNRMELLKLGTASQNVAYVVAFCAEQFGIQKGDAEPRLAQYLGQMLARRGNSFRHGHVVLEDGDLTLRRFLNR